MHTKFSFILPAWKGRYLREAIRSILGQSYRDFELIVVDDCSPEPLKEIVGEFQDTRVEYYRNEHNIGGKDLVAQWNHCLQYAHGDYVILATDDDLYEPRFLEEMARLIDLYPEVDLLRSRIMQTDKTHILHEIGKDTFVVRFWGRDYRIYHSPSFRYYYGARNRIYIARKWKKYGLPLHWQIREITSLMILSLKYEDHKWANFQAYFTGMIKGFFMPLHYNSV